MSYHPPRPQPVVPMEAQSVPGHYALRFVAFDVPASSAAPIEQALTWPFPVEVMAGVLHGENVQAGDRVYIRAEPGVVGTTTAAAAVGATVIAVSQSVLDNVDPGYHVSFDGYASAYRVTTKDAAALTLTLETVLAAAVAAGAAVSLRIEFTAADYEAPTGESVTFGYETSTGTYLPAAKPIKVTLIPVSGAARRVRGRVAYLY